MKECGRMEVQLQAFLTLALDGGIHDITLCISVNGTHVLLIGPTVPTASAIKKQNCAQAVMY